MADKAGGNPDVWKSAVMVCRPLAFLVWCGRPKGGVSYLGGGSVAWGDPLASQLAGRMSLWEPRGTRFPHLQLHLFVCTNTPFRLITNH